MVAECTGGKGGNGKRKYHQSCHSHRHDFGHHGQHVGMVITIAFFSCVLLLIFGIFISSGIAIILAWLNLSAFSLALVAGVGARCGLIGLSSRQGASVGLRVPHQGTRSQRMV